MKKTWKLLSITLGVIAFIIVALVLNITHASSNPNDMPLFKTKETSEQEEETIYIDLKGEVMKPGVYKLKSHTRIYELIELAGGVKATADISNINMAERLYDGTVVYVPSLNTSQGSTNEPTHDNDETASLISISTASLETLMTLPNIGEATAQNIISYRNTHGPFETKEALLNVNNIGPSTYEKIEPLIRP